MPTIEELRRIAAEARAAANAAEKALQDALNEAAPFRVGQIVRSGYEYQTNDVFRIDWLRASGNYIEVRGCRLLKDGTFGKQSRYVYSPIAITDEEIAALNIKGGL